MVERRHGTGRVLLCAVPLDASWGTNLAESPAFVPLVHETIFHLAGARSAEYNLRPGEPIRLRVPADARLDAYRVIAPDGTPLVAQLSEGMLTADTGESGVYLVRPPTGEAIPFVVASDGREADLTPCSAEERERVQRLIGGSEAEQEDAPKERRELWWVLLGGLLGLLVVEVWLTRRMAMKSNG